MKTLILFSTALTVSLDSFICGLSLSIKTKENFKIIFGISLSVFIICLLGSVIGTKLYATLSRVGELIGGLILIAISVNGINRKAKETTLLKTTSSNTLKESVIIGLAIGIDGAVGCLSLAIMGITSLIVPVFITAMHILLMNFAIAIANTPPAKTLKKHSLIPYFILLALGIYKIVSFLS